MKVFSHREDLWSQTLRVLLCETGATYELLETKSGRTPLPSLETGGKRFEGFDASLAWLLDQPAAKIKLPAEGIQSWLELAVNLHQTVMAFSAAHVGRAVDERALAPLTMTAEKVYQVLDQLEQALGEKAFLCGEDYTMADALFIAPLSKLEQLDVVISPEREALLAWREELLERPCVHA